MTYYYLLLQLYNGRYYSPVNTYYLHYKNNNVWKITHEFINFKRMIVNPNIKYKDRYYQLRSIKTISESVLVGEI